MYKTLPTLSYYKSQRSHTKNLVSIRPNVVYHMRYIVPVRLLSTISSKISTSRNLVGI